MVFHFSYTAVNTWGPQMELETTFLIFIADSEFTLGVFASF